MRHFKAKLATAFGSAMIGSLMIPGVALPADLPDSKYMPPPPPMFIWSGFYLGLSAGATWSDIDGDALGTLVPPEPPIDNFSASFDSTSFRGGLYGGYNWQFDRWVSGIEADVAWANGSERQDILLGLPALPGDGTKAEFDWDVGLRLRIGYLLAPTFLLYGTGGVTWQSFEFSAIGPGFSTVWNSEDEVATGWTVGGGVEFLMPESFFWRADSVLARVEYRYTDFGSDDVSFFESGLGMDFDRRTQVVLLGLAYKY